VRTDQSYRYKLSQVLSALTQQVLDLIWRHLDPRWTQVFEARPSLLPGSLFRFKILVFGGILLRPIALQEHV